MNDDGWRPTLETIGLLIGIPLFLGLMWLLAWGAQKLFELKRPITGFLYFADHFTPVAVVLVLVAITAAVSLVLAIWRRL